MAINIKVTIPEEHADTLTGWLGMWLAQNNLSDDAREAFENIYNQLTNEEN